MAEFMWSPPVSLLPTPTLYGSPMVGSGGGGGGGGGGRMRLPESCPSTPPSAPILYHAAVRGRSFQIKSGYVLTGRILGAGAYATVLEANSTASFPSVRVAIKVVNVVSDFFESVRSLREVKILKYLDGCPTAARLLDGWLHGAQVYLVLPAYDLTLHAVLNDPTMELTEDHLRRIALHLLRAVAYMHEGSILHRDIKPSNVLVQRDDCSLGLCDFNLARPAGRTAAGERLTPLTPFAALPHMSTSVVTRWYRAPEVLLDEPYSYAVDMWAVGATLAEFALRRPLWPSRSDTHQLRMYVATLGRPPAASMVEWSPATRGVLASLPPSAEVGALPTVSAGLLNLLRRILVWQPSARLTAQQALQDPWLAGTVSPLPLPLAPMDDAYEAEFVVEGEPHGRADVLAAIRSELAAL